MKPEASWVYEQANSLYLSITVDNIDLQGEQKIAAVPFAVRAAEALDFKVKRNMEYIGMIPKGTVIMVNLKAEDFTYFDSSGKGSGPYEGWAFCNGNPSNGTLNLHSRFPRFADPLTPAGDMNGNDEISHTHSIEHKHNQFDSGRHGLTLAQMPSHTHIQEEHSHTLRLDAGSISLQYRIPATTGPAPSGTHITDNPIIGTRATNL